MTLQLKKWIKLKTNMANIVLPIPGFKPQCINQWTLLTPPPLKKSFFQIIYFLNFTKKSYQLYKIIVKKSTKNVCISLQRISQKFEV